MNVLTTLSISRPIVAVISVMQQSNSLFNLNWMFVFSNLLVTVGDMKVAAGNGNLLHLNISSSYSCFIDTDEISCGQFKRG